MAGLYLHIPFCRQACHYCNFHFLTSFKKKEELIASMQDELRRRAGELPGEAIDTIYFGGGTPSAVDPVDIDALIKTAHFHYAVAPDPEITLEANPEDISPERLALWKASGINRLSIGVQGFQDDMLKSWNRAHDAGTALASIKLAQSAGFDNISIDLIYGGSDLDDEAWLSNLETVIDLGVPHISSYALTVEARTALDYQVRNGLRLPLDDEHAARQYGLLQEILSEAGYDQYEVSNFAQPGAYSRHNLAYWLDIPYIGIGPSAHSYDGVKRQWNVAHNIKYIEGMQAGAPIIEHEILMPAQRYNEMVMTGLRTAFGIDTEQVESLGEEYLGHLMTSAKRFIDSGMIIVADDGRLILNPEVYFLSDGIAADLFMA